MVTPVRDADDFPYNKGADFFVREFSRAVAPDKWKYLARNPPLIIAGVPGEGRTHDEAVYRVAMAFRRALDAVPNTFLTAEKDDGMLLSVQAVWGLQNVPLPYLTRERYPQFWLMESLVDCIRRQHDCWGSDNDLRRLRDCAFQRQRAERSGILGQLTLRALDGGWPLWIFGSGVYSLHRALWWWWMSRKVMRWLRELPVAAGSSDLFRVMDHVAAVQAPRLTRKADDPHHDEALQELEHLLVRALLEDLRTPRQRRRIARPVLLVVLPPPGAEGAHAAERFLIALHQARVTAEQSSPMVIVRPLVIGVGRPSEFLLARLGNPPESDLLQAGLALRQKDESPVLVTFREMELAGPGLKVPPAKPARRFRLGRRAMSLVQAAFTAMRKGVMSVPIKQSEGIGQSDASNEQQHRRAWVAVGVWIVVLLAGALIGLREVLDSFQAHGRLGPSDAPAAVTTIVALGTATGTLIGVTLTAYAKYVQARGQAGADMVRAKAELIRAEADMIRARAGLPAAEPSANGDSTATPLPPEPETN
ncbi:hypothetical protein [Streptomyces sp. NPDC005046]